MPYFSVNQGNIAALTTAYKSGVATWTVATGVRRIKWYEIIIGATSLPNATDAAIQVDVSRITGTTTIAGTTATMSPLDQADGAAITVGLTNCSAEALPVTQVTNSLMNFGLNQRNTTRWIAAQESQYLISPATSLNGLICRALSNTAYTGGLATQVTFQE